MSQCIKAENKFAKCPVAKEYLRDSDFGRYVLMYCGPSCRRYKAADAIQKNGIQNHIHPNSNSDSKNNHKSNSKPHSQINSIHPLITKTSSNVVTCV